MSILGPISLLAQSRARYVEVPLKHRAKRTRDILGIKTLKERVLRLDVRYPTAVELCIACYQVQNALQRER